MKYRREIDGLRSIAVLSVILFHGGIEFVSGGFVGVDVFFVISGFLITSIIVSEQQAGTFSLVGFYERRARRILPALLLVVVACMPFAYAWMVPYQLIDFSESVIAVSLFASNILFWRESGYFGAASEIKPLLHTWSLAVEEQYYILFPLFVMVMWRFGIRVLTAAIVVVILLSLGLSEWAIQRSIVVANFYLLPTRAWELLIGSLVALLSIQFGRADLSEDGTASKVLNQIGSAVGLALILFSIFFYSRATPFPSVYALVPTVGTAMVIWFAKPSTLVARLLSLPPFVGVGLISYSAYLWHQPLFAFARIYNGGAPPQGLMYALMGLSLVLAWFSWRFVERPFRDRKAISRMRIFALASGASACVVGIAAVCVATSGFLGRYQKDDHYLLVTNPSELGRYVERRFRKLNSGKFSEGHAKTRVLVVGDSFAQDFINMAFENGFMSDAEVVTFAIANRCPSYIGGDNVGRFYRDLGKRYDKAYCEQFGNLQKARAMAAKADVVILVSSWKLWEVERIDKTVSALVDGGAKTVIVLGGKDFGIIRPLDFVKVAQQDRAGIQNDVPALRIETNNTLKRVLPTSRFVDVLAMICPGGIRCPLFTPDSRLISYDGKHLTPEGARYVGKIVFQHPLLEGLR